MQVIENFDLGPIPAKPIAVCDYIIIDFLVLLILVDVDFIVMATCGFPTQGYR